MSDAPFDFEFPDWFMKLPEEERFKVFVRMFAKNEMLRDYFLKEPSEARMMRYYVLRDLMRWGEAETEQYLMLMEKAHRQIIAESLEGLSRAAVLKVAGIVVPGLRVDDGVLVRSSEIIWHAIVQRLGTNWNLAFEIPPVKWEELIAGAFDKAGFDEVVLTPRSGDLGRDVIATKNGIGSIKIVGSVKAYKPGHLVRHDDVRALLGVMSAEQNTSKGILTTTSDFAPKIVTDPLIKPFLPTRLELVNGTTLQKWLVELSKRQ